MSILKVAIITGSRENPPDWVRDAILQIDNDYDLIIVGDADGVDRFVRVHCESPFVPVAAFWKDDGLSAGPIRNQQMIVLGKEFQKLVAEVTCFGFPSEASRGTHNCLKWARQYGIETVVAEAF